MCIQYTILRPTLHVCCQLVHAEQRCLPPGVAGQTSKARAAGRQGRALVGISQAGRKGRRQAIARHPQRSLLLPILPPLRLLRWSNAGDEALGIYGAKMMYSSKYSIKGMKELVL
jgi:hypothetical protein